MLRLSSASSWIPKLLLLVVGLPACEQALGDAFRFGMASDAGRESNDAGPAAYVDARGDGPLADPAGGADICTPDPSACASRCGQVTNGCNQLVQCGGCGNGETCGGGGTPNRCGVGTCTPSCANHACGASDGCADLCTQGTCATGLYCATSVCLCDPSSCYACSAGRCTGAETKALVLFGGFEAPTTVLGDTWEGDGTSWTRQDVAGPGARAQHAMASLGSKVLLFGGVSASGTPLGDTWEWDGSAWTQRNVSGPSARWGHAMSTLGSAIVLFGGYDTSGRVTDTWEWDGNAWTQRSGVGPQTGLPQMAPLGGKLVLFGTDGTWEWDRNTWTKRDVSNPVVDSFTLAAIGGAVVLFGSNADLAMTWEWDGNIWTQALVSNPSDRAGQAMASFRGKVFVFGGNGFYGPLSDTWTWDGSRWTLSSSGPAARYNAAMAVR